MFAAASVSGCLSPFEAESTFCTARIQQRLPGGVLKICWKRSQRCTPRRLLEPSHGHTSEMLSNNASASSSEKFPLLAVSALSISASISVILLPSRKSEPRAATSLLKRSAARASEGPYSGTDRLQSSFKMETDSLESFAYFRTAAKPTCRANSAARSLGKAVPLDLLQFMIASVSTAAMILAAGRLNLDVKWRSTALSVWTAEFSL